MQAMRDDARSTSNRSYRSSAARDQKLACGSRRQQKLEVVPAVLKGFSCNEIGCAILRTRWTPEGAGSGCWLAMLGMSRTKGNARLQFTGLTVVA